MNLLHLTPGAGAMYCGGCLRDNALVAALRKLGHEVVMVPLYLPLTLDEEDQSAGTPLFFGGISVYLEQKSTLFREAPGWLHDLFASRRLLNWAAGKAAKTRPSDLGVCKSALCFWTETPLYQFSGSSDGANPGYGQLTFDQAGNLYGTTIFGGVNARGVVYELTPSGSGWTERAIHTFSGSSDGENPYSSVIFDPAGNLYGTAFQGGAHGYGAVFQLTPSGSGWTEKTLYAFQNLSDGGQPFGGVVLDNAGNLYAATSSGGSGNGGTVYQLIPSGSNWIFSLLYSFASGGYLPGPYASLTMDAAGDLYGTTKQDGAHAAGSIFKLTPSGGGWTETDLYDFTGGSDGGVPYGSVVIDASGNLYGTASQGGTHGYGVIWEITP